jgi:protein-S-isoprenylcysteine O-methyltransferase Ste14
VGDGFQSLLFAHRSYTVRNGHAVVAEGPYRYVRHPAYAGMIVFELAMPTLLASWWAIISSGLCVILLILRTTLEDRTLQAELAG